MKVLSLVPQSRSIGGFVDAVLDKSCDGPLSSGREPVSLVFILSL